MADRHELRVLAGLAIGLILLPWILSMAGLTYSTAVECVALAMAGLALNVLLGYTGLVSFGHGAWFGLGGYAVGILQLRYFQQSSLIPLVLALVLVAATAVVIGFLILRRRGVYFSLLTLAFAALCFSVAYRWTSLTGGENGLGGIERRSLIGLDLDDSLFFYAFVAIVGWCVAACLLRLAHSPLGHVLTAIRENELRTRFIGFNALRYKLVAFVISAAVTALAGGITVLNHRIASAESMSLDSLADTQAQTDALVDYLGVRGMDAALAEDLSYGGQRLVDMGLALGTAPRMLLLDEPLAGLAAAERDRITALIRDLSQCMGVLVVEHDMDRVFGMAGVITVMDQGRLLLEGTPQLVRDDPKVREVYIGSGAGALIASAETLPLAADTLLQAESVDAFYGKSHILSGITFGVRQGEVLAVLGRNGAGKSTLLKTLLGLADLGGGHLVLGGRRIDRPEPEAMARLGIAYVPQGRRVFSGLTVRDNLMLGRLRRRHPSEPGWTDEQIFQLFPRLRDRHDVDASMLSGGEQQMVAIARALAGHVRILLLDEPFEGLSPAMTEEVFNAVLRLRRKLTVLIVDHDLDLALALADTALVLDRGRITHWGPARPLLVDLPFRRQKLWL